MKTRHVGPGRFTAPLICLALLLCAAAALAAGPAPVVRLWSDAAQYIAGDSLTLRVQADRDCFGRLLYLTASGEVYEIVPSAPAPGAPYLGGKEYVIPAVGDGLTLTIAQPFGREKALFAASFAPLPALPGREAGPGVRRLDVGLDEALRLLGLPGPNRSLTTHEFETLPGQDRGFTRQDPDAPIDMTGAAGREGGPKKRDLK